MNPHDMALELNRMVYELNVQVKSMVEKGIRVDMEITSTRMIQFENETPALRATAYTKLPDSLSGRTS